MTVERLVSTLSHRGADLVLPPRRHGQRPGTARLIDTAALPGGLLALVELADGGRVLAPMVDGADGWRRAHPGDGVSARLVTAKEPLLVNSFSGVVAPFEGAELALSVDQTNDSVVVGQAVLVKWQVAVSDAPAVAPTVLAHLHEAGFTATTSAVATVRWGDVLVAQVLEFLPGASDGWDWMTDDLLAALDDGTEPELAWPEQVGRLLGDFHTAMATPTSVLPEPVVAVADLGPLHTYFAGLLDQVTGLDAEMQAALEPWRARLVAALAAVATARSVPSLRIHGDAHVGQVLRWERGLALGDFDGNPLLPAEHRADPGPTAYDVASMMRALDHVSHVVRRRAADGSSGESAGRSSGGSAGAAGGSGEVGNRLAVWSAAAQAAFLDGYRATGPVTLLDPVLVAAFADLSVLHEAVYAATHLPRWRYVPLGVLAAVDRQ